LEIKVKPAKISHTRDPPGGSGKKKGGPRNGSFKRTPADENTCEGHEQTLGHKGRKKRFTEYFLKNGRGTLLGKYNLTNQPSRERQMTNGREGKTYRAHMGQEEGW